MLKKISIAIVGLIVLLFGYAALQPAEYIYSREISINAPVAKIFPYLNNPKLSEQWAPWSESDPQAKMIHSGPEAGVGASTTWDSTGQLGTGSATVVESAPGERVAIALEYTKPFAMSQYAEYLVKPTSDQTVVIWRVSGKNNIIGRVVCIFMNPDKMVGAMFEKGLLNLKTLVEKSA